MLENCVLLDSVVIYVHVKLNYFQRTLKRHCHSCKGLKMSSVLFYALQSGDEV